MKPFLYRGRFIFIPLAIAAFVAVTGFVVMNLWNWLIPAIFHLGFIDFWQAVGIFVLAKILFGFGKGGRGGHGGAPWMRHRMEERFKNMTPEERENFKARMKERCGHGKWGRYNWDDYKPEAEKTAE